MTSFRPSALPRLRTVAAGLCLAAAALAARADIAVLREKGPHSGSASANLGLVANAPKDLKVAMKTADVKIHLRPGDGDTLKADCSADFELEDSSPSELAGQLYLVGFPVTGLSSKIVTIDQLKVTVDGKEPATVLRRCIGTHFRSLRVEDTPVSGELSSAVLNERSHSSWSIGYEGQNSYRVSYIWQQSVSPAKTVKVRVAYTVILRPQSIRYTKTYDRDEDTDAIIPFDTLTVDNWDDQHFFFDYVLRSGATWHGLIGQETITIAIDPKLHLDLGSIIPMEFRQDKGTLIRDDAQDAAPILPRENDLRDSDGWTRDHAQHAVRFTLRDAEPCFDLLVAIPVSAIKRQN